MAKNWNILPLEPELLLFILFCLTSPQLLKFRLHHMTPSGLQQNKKLYT